MRVLFRVQSQLVDEAGDCASLTLLQLYARDADGGSPSPLRSGRWKRCCRSLVGDDVVDVGGRHHSSALAMDLGLELRYHVR